MLKKKQPTTTKSQDGIIAPSKKEKVKPKKTLTKGTMLNIVEIMRGKALEIKK